MKPAAVSSSPIFASASHYARELLPSDIPRLQALFDANPEYSLAVNGRRPHSDEAQTEFDEYPPEHMSFTRRWFAGLFDRDHEMIGVAIVVSDLCAAQVWHIGLFLVATHLHGRGVAGELFSALETWMQQSGAKWLRLGVVDGNTRAERFWLRHGFCEVRTRREVDTGGRLNTIRVLIKPLADGGLEDYLARVPRDQPEPPK